MRFGRKIIFPFSLLLVAGLLAGSTRGSSLLARQGWGIVSVEIMIVFLALAYWGFEQHRVSPREVAMTATLGAVAAAGRVLFAPLPNVQPTTFMVIVSGFVFGPRAGFMVGSTAALVSNFFLGQGPWTPWQMIAWGLAGASAGIMSAVFPRLATPGMVGFSFLWGYLFGWLMNLWFWTAFVSPPNWPSFAAICAASFWFDTLHAVSNAALYLLLGPGLVRILRRFRRKLEIVRVSSPDKPVAKAPAGSWQSGENFSPSGRSSAAGSE